MRIQEFVSEYRQINVTFSEEKIISSIGTNYVVTQSNWENRSS